MAITDFWIIRHGETDWNTTRRLQGWTDIELNSRGIRQAEVLSHYLANGFFSHPPDHIYSSDLQRAYFTAQTVADRFNLKVAQIHGLRERHYGILEGKHWTDLKDRDLQRQCGSAIELSETEHKAESLGVFYARIRETLLTIAQQHQGQTVLLFSHGGAIDMMWRMAKGLAHDAAREITQKNTAINHLQIDENLIMQVKVWGLTEHVEEAL